MKRNDDLPRLPVPDLHATVAKYVSTLEPLLGDSDRQRVKKLAADFLTRGGPGERLQQRLQEKQQDSAVDNWLEDWWLEGYLTIRDPIGLNVNPGLVIRGHPVPELNTLETRAASLAYHTAQMHLNISGGRQPVDKFRSKPLCMEDYNAFSATTRLPKYGADIMQYNTAKRPTHIVVIYRNRFFSLDVLQEDGEHQEVIKPELLCTAIRKIVDKVKGLPMVPSSERFGALTMLNRDVWAAVREEAMRNQRCAEALRQIESSLFALALEDAAPQEWSKEALTSVFFGSDVGTNRWYDLSLNVVCCRNGVSGVVFDHTIMDSGPAMRWANHIHDSEKAYGRFDVNKAGTPPVGAEILFDTPPTFQRAVVAGVASARKVITSLDVENLHFTHFGTTALKKFSCSSDLFAQFAFQVAFRRFYGFVPNVYESVATKTFLRGRTETGRTLSTKSLRFVDLFLAHQRGNEVDADSLAQAFQDAVADISHSLRGAAAGHGCDRHMLGLRMTADKLLELKPLPEIFRDPTYQTFSTITLSTSHPLQWEGVQQVIFSPVSPKCVGIGYFIYEDSMSFGLSTYRRDTAGFCKALEQSLLEMYNVLGATRAAKKAAL